MYQYRKHLRGTFLNYFIGLIIFSSFVFLGILGTVLSFGEEFNIINFIVITIIMVVIFIFLLFELAIIYFLMIKRFRYINVTLEENEIIYENKKKKIVIPYEEIISIKYPSVRYLGGWMQIKYNGGKIRLTVVLEDIGEFMYRLKEILDEKGKSNTYNEKKSLNFFKTASLVDESWERIYFNIKFILITEYISLIITIILGAIGFIRTEFPLIMLGIAAPIIGYTISEIIIAISFSKRIIGKEFKVLPRDTKKENNILRIGVIASTILYIVIIIL